jgi:acetyl-CoA synthetase
MDDAIIRKGPADLKVTPNLDDYDATRASFAWSQVPDVCAGMGSGGCNIAYAAVDRHAEGPGAERTALRFIADDPGSAALRTHDVSYAELGRLTRTFTNVLRDLGIGKGDKVFVIMGRVPELYISMLGALRNGSVVSPLFSAFGPEPIATRVNIGAADVLVTTAAIYRRKISRIRDQLPSVKHVLIVGDEELPGTHNFHALMDRAGDDAPIEHTGPDDPSLLHFTSGTTGTPKGAQHVHAAVAMHYITGLFALDLHPGDIYWCTADPGWVTGTAYGIIAPLLHGVTSIIDEAEFDAEHWYRILQDEGVTVWYTAPTAIRMLIKAGPELAGKYTFPHLRFVASVGEPLNAEAVWWGKTRAGLTHSRQLVADRDRRHHGRQYPGLRHQARIDGPAAAGCGRRRRRPRRCGRGHRRGQRHRRPGRRRGTRAAGGLAVDVPRLPRPGPALPQVLFE